LIIELSNVNLPVYVIKEEIPENLLSSLELRGIRSHTTGLAVPCGRPRYVNGRLSNLHPK
jgi:hypothetical protein